MSMSIAHAGAESLERVVIDTGALAWTSSPVIGLRYRMLDHTRGHTWPETSIVSYAPQAILPGHEHDGTEELFVLEGLFSDDLGSYAKGTYLRNPSGSTHTR